MVSKSKILVLGVLVVFVLVSGFLLFKMSAQRKYQSQVLLAKEIRKAIDVMMFDLRQAQTPTVKGVPADGQWHHAMAFNTAAQGLVQYALNGTGELQRVNDGHTQSIAFYMGALSFRRQPGDDSMIEVQLKGRNAASLTSNFKIRMQE